MTRNSIFWAQNGTLIGSVNILLTAREPKLHEGIWLYKEAVLKTVNSDGITLEERRFPIMEFRTAVIQKDDGIIRVRVDDRIYD